MLNCCVNSVAKRPVTKSNRLTFDFFPGVVDMQSLLSRLTVQIKLL